MKNDYEIRGDITAIFIKNKNVGVLETIVNTSDLERLIDFGASWHLRFSSTQPFYVQTSAEEK